MMAVAAQQLLLQAQKQLMLESLIQRRIAV